MAMTSLVAQALILMFLDEAHLRQFSTIDIGLVLAASGAGGAVGAFCSRIVPVAIRGLWVPIQMIAWSVALGFLFLAGGQSVYLGAGAMFILGLTGAIGNVEFATYLLRNVGDDMIAKVTGIGQVLAIGACAIGPVLGGYAVQRFQIQGAIAILFGIVMALAFISLLFPTWPERAAEARESANEFVPDSPISPPGNARAPHPATAWFLDVNRGPGQAVEWKVVPCDGPVSLVTRNSRP
jgi:hypothetical protein